jgi:hypothetical protein
MTRLALHMPPDLGDPGMSFDTPISMFSK